MHKKNESKRLTCGNKRKRGERKGERTTITMKASMVYSPRQQRGCLCFGGLDYFSVYI